MNLNEHRTALLRDTVEILNKYTEFSTEYQVSFSLAEPGADGVPRIAARFEPADGKTPAAASARAISALNNQTALIRPFFVPMVRAEWDNRDVNEIQTVDFDFAAIIGYGKESDYFVKTLCLPSASALLSEQRESKDGNLKFPLATYTPYQLSLEPREKFAKFLYLSERMCEALVYQQEKIGQLYSVEPRK